MRSQTSILNDHPSGDEVLLAAAGTHLIYIPLKIFNNLMFDLDASRNLGYFTIVSSVLNNYLLHLIISDQYIFSFLKSIEP